MNALRRFSFNSILGVGTHSFHLNELNKKKIEYIATILTMQSDFGFAKGDCVRVVLIATDNTDRELAVIPL